ncbi:MAG: alpha-2-macroglobulin family protein, partial [Acidobacteriota bacterium]
MKKAIVSVLASAIALQAAFAAGGQGAVEGTIVDSETGKLVIANVTVAIQCGNVRKSTSIDGTGHFKLDGLPEGSCTLTTGGATYAGTAVGVAVAGGAISTIVVNVQTKAYLEKLRKQQEAQRVQWERMEKRQRAMRPSHAKRAMKEMDFGGFEGGVAAGAPMAAPMPAEMEPPPARAPARPMHRPATKPAPVAHGAGRGGGGAGPRVAMAPPVMPRRPVMLEQKNLPLRRQQLRNQLAGNNEQINGWAPVRVFPVPMYTKAYDGPRDDFRETIYWNGEVETDAHGDATVTFAASDAVTNFRATAEGFSAQGTAGGGTSTFASKLPLTLDAHLPTEVTSGDTIQLPVTIANETDEALDAKLATKFGAAFRLAKSPVDGTIHLAPHAKQSYFFPLDVVATDGSGDISLDLAARGLHDQMTKTIRVVPKGFPFEASASGTAHNHETSHHTVTLAGAMPGTIRATVTMYPSPVAAMTKGMEAMIREPGGCFEQTSSSNYPNVMVLAYMEKNDAADPQLVATTRSKLEHGYKILTGYETTEKGYEWFGHTPGHEALTAYGLMEFADMSKVYDVDHAMVERTADWLMKRRDGQGGFMRSKEALDSFGRASEQTTTAYIMWALAEAHRTGGMTKELEVQQALARETKDPYLLALAANTALLARSSEASSAVKRLVAMQGKDGGWTGAKETITMSGGEALQIETTALATLALIKASPNSEYEPQIRSAVDWLNSKRGGYGAWGNTQATILGLKALTAYSEHAKQMQASGTATLFINGKDAGKITFDKGRREALVWNNLGDKLQPGKNTIDVRLDGPSSLPYTVAIEYRSSQPQSSPKAKIAVTTQLLKTSARMGEGVTLRAHVENTTKDGVPMTLARIGLPGGTVFQTWQLKELRDKGLVDFYETRPREVILYWRALPPGAKKDVDLNLLAAV